jgi:hypothetical protein
MSDRVFAWRHVALVLASQANEELLGYVGLAGTGDEVRIWARRLLDSVDDFYEVYPSDPDGGVAADAIEASLAILVDPQTLAKLRDGAELLARPIDGDLDEWSKVLSMLPHQDDPEIPVPRWPLREPLRATVMRIAEGVPRSGPDSEFGLPHDEWERWFGDRHDSWPEDIAHMWADLILTREVARRLLAALSADEVAELEAWADAEMTSDPRQPLAPVAPSLTLATAARDAS